jgi:hypothetical protein
MKLIGCVYSPRIRAHRKLAARHAYRLLPDRLAPETASPAASSTSYCWNKGFTRITEPPPEPLRPHHQPRRPHRSCNQPVAHKHGHTAAAHAADYAGAAIHPSAALSTKRPPTRARSTSGSSTLLARSERVGHFIHRFERLRHRGLMEIPAQCPDAQLAIPPPFTPGQRKLHRAISLRCIARIMPLQRVV